MKFKTSWNLGLLYKNDNDPQIEADLKKIDQVYESFEKKYKGQPFTKTPESLAKALSDHEELIRGVMGHKPWWYFALKSDIDSNDKKVEAMAAKTEQRLNESANKIKFFPLEIGKIPASDREKFLKHPALQPYQYELTVIFNDAEHNLTEQEEQLDGLLMQPAYTMWTEANDRLMSQQVIVHKGKKIPLSKALVQYHEMPKADRRAVYEKIIENYKAISFFSENEINAIFNYKKIMDKRRGYKKPYSASILLNENDEKSIEDFVALVTRYFKISHKFYALHAKIIGEKKLHMGDRNVNIGKIKKKFSLETSIEILRAILTRLDPEYVQIFDSFLKNGQVDMYPRTGKQSGAYSWGMGELPVFVLMNFVNDVNSLETLAHEVGHAIHNELSKRQPPRYQKYSTATAEVASTFFEQIVSEEIEKHLSEKEKTILLHNKLMGDVSAIFRQIACFNFETELHNKVRAEGKVSRETMATLLSEHLKSYLGKAANVTEDDGYFYVGWWHLRRFFYVYTYAYGQLISRALYENWKKDPSYSTKVKQFLLAGRSMSPENIFKSIGIDTNQAFFEAGLKGIEADIDRLEKLTDKSKKRTIRK